MASNYYYPTSKNAIQKTLAAQLLSTASTGDAITFDDVDGVQNKPGVLVINRVDSNGTATPSSREFISFTGTSGNTVLIETRNVDSSGAARTHVVGSIVEFISDGVWGQRVIDQALVEHGVDGTHSDVTATSVTSGTIEATTSADLKTLAIDGGTAMTAVKDEDDMASNSATALATQQSIKAYVDVYGQNTSLARQAVMNGNFDVDQRVGPYTASRNNDDVYTLDRWNLISDGNDVLDVSQEAITDLPGSNYAIKLDVETAKRAGIVQFLEAKDAQKFKGKSVSISFAVKSANISAIRATVLSWASTADSVTSDIVASWAATPTWATNWADNATPADLTVTSSWTTVKVENIAIDESTVNNLALAIWLPNEETIGDIVYISQVQMNMGSVALPFQPKSFEEELRACQRYYETSYGDGTTPGTADGYDETSTTFFGFTAGGGVDAGGCVTYRVKKKTTPVVTLYAADAQTGAGTAARVRDGAVGGLETITSIKPATTNSTAGFSGLVSSTGLTAGRAYSFNWVSSAEL